MDYIKHPLEDTLLFEKPMPVAWEGFDLSCAPGVFAPFNHTNENLLRVLLSLDDAIKEHDDGIKEVSHELQRVEAKLDLLLQWLGQWVATTQGVPPEVPVVLSESGLSVILANSGRASVIEVGLGLLFHVYLDKHYPQALHLPAEVYSVEQTPAGCLVVVRFAGLHTDVYDLIEKFIFREHRRRIAASKRNP